jgi:hypothetical protein
MLADDARRAGIEDCAAGALRFAVRKDLEVVDIFSMAARDVRGILPNEAKHLHKLARRHRRYAMQTRSLAATMEMDTERRYRQYVDAVNARSDQARG